MGGWHQVDTPQTQEITRENRCKKDVDPNRDLGYTLYMMNTTETKANGTTTTINARGKTIKVYADGTANCCDCGGDYHPDDMKDSMLCLVCYDDRHADDWTMEDC